MGHELVSKSIKFYDDLELDIHSCAPETHGKDGAGPKPVVIVIHGGAWISGYKENVSEICETVAQGGYITVCPNYILTSLDSESIVHIGAFQVAIFIYLIINTSGRIRTLWMIAFCASLLTMIAWTINRGSKRQINGHCGSVVKCIEWVYHNITAHGGSPDNLFLLGYSAGGHIASLVANNPHFLRRVSLSTSIIKGVVCIGSPFSDKRVGESVTGRYLLQNVFPPTENCDMNRITMVENFPIYWISPKSPPHLLINADVDFTLQQHTWDFFHVLYSNGVYVDTARFENTDHFNIKFWKNDFPQVGRYVLDFLKKVCKHPTSYDQFRHHPLN